MQKVIEYIALIPERIFLRLAIWLHCLSFFLWERVKHKRSGIMALAWKFRMRTLGWALSEAKSYNDITGEDMARTRAQALMTYDYVLISDRKTAKNEQTIFRFRDLDNIEVTKVKDSLLGLGQPRGESEQRDGLRISQINLQTMSLNMMLARLVGWERLMSSNGKEIRFPRTNDTIKDILGSLEVADYEELIRVFGTPDGRGKNEVDEKLEEPADDADATPF